jgi:antitoxin (DNA-binding transcriptional repressor) of toxin-antitoxin stability system
MSTIAISPSRLHGNRTIHHRPAARRAGSGATVRLTRRGRLVLLLVALTAVLVAGFFLGAGSVATQERGTSPATEVVMVAPGETLWDIASRLTPAGDDVRDTMFDIRRLNALTSSALDAGQRIRVPAE